MRVTAPPAGVQGGFAPLDSGLHVPIANLPVGTGASQVAAGNHVHAGYDKDNGQAGMIAPSAPGWAYTTLVWPTANLMRTSRFVPSRVMTVIAIEFSTIIAATNNDACDVAILNAAGVKIVSAGATTGKLNATAGPQSVTIASTVLQPGTVYYAGFSYGAIGGTAATLLMANWVAGAATTQFGATVGLIEATTQGSSHPIVGPMTAGATTASPVLTLRES